MEKTTSKIVKKGTTKNRSSKKEVTKKVSKKESILLQVDEATKGIMEEIQSAITDDIVEPIEAQKKELKDINEKLEELFALERENNKLLKKLLKTIGK